MSQPDNPTWVQPSERANKLAAVLAMQVNAAFRFRDRHGDIVADAEELLASFGATHVESMPFETTPVALVRLPGPMSNGIHFTVLDQTRPFMRKIHHEYPTQKLTAMSPGNAHFWMEQNDGGIVKQSYYSQTMENEVLPFANGIITFDEQTITFLFLPPGDRSVQWPLDDAEGLYKFDSEPTLISRAWRVYTNACDTRGESYFFDMNPSHYTYKHVNYGTQGQQSRLGVSFDRANPKHGRLVQT